MTTCLGRRPVWVEFKAENGQNIGLDFKDGQLVALIESGQ